jgi:Mn-dependent DtxR family transcriptional regulator
MQATKELEREQKKTVLTILEEEKMPVSVGFIADRMQISWHAIQTLLFKMSLNGEIIAMQTSNGYLFSLKTTNN